MTEKIALITGSSRKEGIGFAVARELGSQGFHVVLTSREVAKAQTLADQLRGEGIAAEAMELDIKDDASVARCAAAVGEKFGRLDVLVNNAGSVPDFESHSIFDADPEKVREAFDVELIGNWQLTEELLPHLREAPAARIVNVSSQSALEIANAATRTDPIEQPAHCMAKYALNALTAAFAADLRGTPILVNAVDPGGTASHPDIDDGGDSRPAAESAPGIVWAATLRADGPSGGFFHDGRPLS